MEYLGRYTHKIAISNHRLLDINNKSVSFAYKDYRQEGKHKQMQLGGEEFLRRFSQHILPYGFVRIRHYGMLASRNKSKELNLVKSFFGEPRWEKTTPITWQQIAREKLGFEPQKCPSCKNGLLEVIQIIHPQRGPPEVNIIPNKSFIHAF